MATKLRSCIVCRSETRFELLTPVSGEDSALTVTARGLPVLVCPSGHRQFADPAFPARLLEHLIEEDEPRLPAGDERGLLFKHFFCRECGGELAAKPDHRHTFGLDVSLPDTSPVHIDLTMPVYRCTGCGKEQLHSLKEVRARTPGALARAFQAGEIRAH